MSSSDILEKFSSLFAACLEDFVKFEIFGLFWSYFFSRLTHFMHRSTDLVLFL